MITIEVKRKGNLEKIISGMATAAAEGVKNAVEGTHTATINTKRQLTNSSGGVMEAFIKQGMTKESALEAEGKVYADDERFLFLEYGTGTKAELPHIGTTKTFIESGYQYWLLPADKSSRDFGVRRTIFIKGQKFYIMYAQEPKPVFRSTAFNRRDENVEEVRQAIKSFVKENAL